MALRVSLQIDGDSSGAEQAAKATSEAVKAIGKDAADAAKGLEDAFNKASGAGEKAAMTAKAFGAANDNVSSTSTNLVGLLDQVAQKTLGADNAFAKLSGGVNNVVKSVAAIGPMVGPIGLLGSMFGIAVTAATTFFSIVNSGVSQSSPALTEHARLVGVVRDAYSGAATSAGEFLKQSRAVTAFEAERNLIRLQAQLKTQATEFVADYNKRAAAYSSSFYGLDGKRSTALDEEAKGVLALKPAVDILNDGIKSGAINVDAFRGKLTDVSRSALSTLPQVGDAFDNINERGKSLYDTAGKVKEANAILNLSNGTDVQKSKSTLGIAAATGQATNEFDRMTKALTRQIIVQEAEAATVGKSAGEQMKFRTQMLLVEAAQRSGLDASGKYAAVIDLIASRAGAAGQKLAEMNIRSNAAFDFSQLGRSAGEQNIAGILRQAYGDNVDAYMNSAIAGTLRFNQAMLELKSTTLDVSQGIFRDFRNELMNGTSAWEAFGKAGVNALGRIADKIAEKSLDSLVSNMFGSFLGGGGGTGWLGKLFGGGSSGAITLGGPSGPTPFFAAAGGTFGPGWGVVGEEGPEIIKVGYGGVTVFPNAASKPYLPGFAQGGTLSALGSVSRLPSSSAGAPIQIVEGDTHITVEGSADEKTLKAFRDELDTRDRRRRASFLDDLEAGFKKLQADWRVR